MENRHIKHFLTCIPDTHDIVVSDFSLYQSLFVYIE